MTTKVNFTWATRREGNDGYVLEMGPDGHKVEFGPMPPHTVPAFAAGRRKLIEAAMTDLDHTKLSPLNLPNRKDH